MMLAPAGAWRRQPYFGSTPPEAYFRPDRKTREPTRAAAVKDGRHASREACSPLLGRSLRAASTPAQLGGSGPEGATTPCRSWLPCHAFAVGGATAALLPHRTSGALLAGRSCLRLGSAQGGAIDVDANAAVAQTIEQRINEVLLLKQLVPVGQLE